MDLLTRTFRLFSLFGTEVKVHISIIFIGLIVLFSRMDMLLYVSLMFFFVLIHEFAHVGMARIFGVYCNRITMHVFGAGAEVRPIGRPPKDLLIVLAGPLCNFALAGIFYLIRYHLGRNGFIDMCILTNVILGSFNILPIWPLDGGRALINLLKIIGFSSAKSTDITYYISTLAIIVTLWFFHSVFMVIMFFVIWLSLHVTWKKGSLLSA